MPKVIVGLSGGVDSSVAAYLLLKQGYEVEGLFMQNWDDATTNCPAEQDLKDAMAVCLQLKIHLHTVSFTKAYWDQVFMYFLDEYAKGRTPNPDILCNKEIKFKAFLDHALKLGADFIATGHYARVKITKHGVQLLKAKDSAKDQSYFLHAVSPAALEKTLFPIGELLKSEVRSLAKSLGFVTHNKKDSTGICFIGERRFKPFLNEFLLAKPGPIVSTTGEILGQHDGLMFYTYGQRQGLQIGGKKNSQQAPWYVVAKDIANNTLIIAQGQDHAMLYAQSLLCGPIHWLISPPELPLHCYAKTRYRQTDQRCTISEGVDNKYHISFLTPQRAITPGQYVVFYQNQQCFGGAVIDSLG